MAFLDSFLPKYGAELPSGEKKTLLSAGRRLDYETPFFVALGNGKKGLKNAISVNRRDFISFVRYHDSTSSQHHLKGTPMAVYLSHESAIEMLCFLRTREVEGDEATSQDEKRPKYDTSWCKACTKTLGRDAAYLKNHYKSLDSEAKQLLENLTQPLHVLVPDTKMVTMNEAFHPHLWRGDVGRRAFIDLGNDIYLSMPAFVFVQMAPKMSFVDLIMLGMMFCGYYSPGPHFGRSEKNDNLDTPLEELHKQMVCSAQVFEIEPICTEQRLQSFINHHPSIYGAKAVRAATKWVRNTSASHMETALYLLLSLPVRMGGYGLPKPLLNPKVQIIQASGEKTCYPDLFWKSASIDLEYASDWAHTGVRASYLDSRRLTAIVCNDIDYLSITTGQLRRPIDLDNAARGLARKLNHRIRNAEKDWLNKRAQLRLDVLPPRFEANAAYDGIDDTSQN